MKHRKAEGRKEGQHAEQDEESGSKENDTRTLLKQQTKITTKKENVEQRIRQDMNVDTSDLHICLFIPLHVMLFAPHELAHWCHDVMFSAPETPVPGIIIVVVMPLRTKRALLA